MPTLESSLREAAKAGLRNDTVEQAKKVVSEQKAANAALTAACAINEEKALRAAVKIAVQAGLGGSRGVDEANRRLEGLAAAKQRAKNEAQARRERDARRKTDEALRAAAQGSSMASPSQARLGNPTDATDMMTLVNHRTKRHGLRDAHMPLLSLARTPLPTLKDLVPKKLPMQVTWEKLDVSSKAGELFLRGARVLCERSADEHVLLETDIRAAAGGNNDALAHAVDRVTRANALFVTAQKTALAAYGVLNTSTMHALEHWLLSTAMPELTVKETRQRLREAQGDVAAAINALAAHRVHYRANAEAHLLQCREEEALARTLMTRGQARLADLGMPVTEETVRGWNASLLASRLERLGHFLFSVKVDLDHLDLKRARAGTARALKIVKTLVRFDPSVPDPIIALLETVLEAMDHPLTQAIFAEDTDLSVGRKLWSSDDQKSKPPEATRPVLPSLANSSSAPLLEGELVLPHGLFVQLSPSPRPSTDNHRLPSSTSMVAKRTEQQAPAAGLLRTSASQPVLPAPSSWQSPRQLTVSSTRMVDEAKVDRARRTTSVRSKFHIQVDQALAGMNGSGRVLDLELRRLVVELESRLHPTFFVATDGMDFDQSCLVQTLAQGLQAWLARYNERERRREEERDIAVREAVAKKRAAALYTHTAVDDAGAKSVMEHLRKALANNLDRTIDFFRDCDGDGSGKIDRREFRSALGKVVPGVSKGVCAALFDTLDADGSDTIEYAELHTHLRPRAQIRRAKSQSHEQTVR